MTASGGDRILKDINGNISDHLQNHIHLTNCIHLKNHLHNHTPFAADKALLRDLILLQKSRRLRDPSGSSSIVHDLLLQKQEKDYDALANSGLPPVGSELRKGGFRKTPKKETRGRFRRNRPKMSPSPATEHDGCKCSNPRNNCGIPWNWSRIHDKGKQFLGSRLNREGSSISDRSNMSENSSSSSVYSREAFPLLLDASKSQESTDHAPWPHDYSGELGIFTDSVRKPETDQRVRRQHQNLTQKYMPRTFSDLIGQNLVVQALSNAVAERKIGLLYVFYGPHGTGKTACARIFARALNCHSVKGPKPCGFCDSCVENETGKSWNVREIGPVSGMNYERLMKLFDKSINASHSLYRVFVFDECDAMAPDCWSAITKVIYRAPRRVAIVLVCSSLDSLPHVVVSRCQKFFFTKLKDADIVHALQRIASKEDLEIDKDALKLIASRSDGSLRDAEMTLEQLSLLGQRISLCLVQELIGLISDEKLLDLLDFALSADTINTVRNLRDIAASGVEPLALMSQLATVITDILAGSYGSVKQRPKRKFFQRQALSKEDMEKLRQALKTLSEAEKQLRVSSERMTWLTAALLQLAPDQHYMNPDSSSDTTSSSSDVVISEAEDDARKMNEIWLQVLENIKIKSLKEFMYKEGKMIKLSYGAAPTVQLLFNSQLTKSVVEKFRSRILQAFEAVLRSPATIEIRQGSRKDTTVLLQVLNEDSAPQNDSRSDEIVEVEDDNKDSLGAVYREKTFDGGDLSERNNSLSIVRRKMSLGQVILHADACSSIADKLEQENLRLEPRSRRLLCWNPPRMSRHTLSCLKIRRKPQSLAKFVPCGRCHSARSPN